MKQLIIDEVKQKLKFEKGNYNAYKITQDYNTVFSEEEIANFSVVFPAKKWDRKAGQKYDSYTMKVVIAEINSDGVKFDNEEISIDLLASDVDTLSHASMAKGDIWSVTGKAIIGKHGPRIKNDWRRVSKENLQMPAKDAEEIPDQW